MITTADQATREIAVFVGNDKLALRKFSGREELSRLFEYDLEMLSGDRAIDPAEIIGGNVTFLISENGEAVRHFNGFVRAFGQNDHADRTSTYHAAVVPWLWFLTQTADCRIFQDKSTPEIIEQIFQDLGFDWCELRLSAKYEAREYCVQYRETDFDFVSRLMEEEGIFYYFRHENGKHTLVLADHASSYFELTDNRVECLDAERDGILTDQITNWRHEKRFSSGRWSHTDYDFKTPSNRLMTNADSLVELKDNKVFEVYDYPGRYEEKGDGKAWVDRRIEEEETPHDTVLGRGGYRSFTPGGTFSVARHKNEVEVGGSYVLVSVETKATVNGAYVTGTQVEEVRFENKFRCIPDHVPFRPRRRTPRALVEGPQTAFVVGPAGEEIYTDEFGRVKVQFHWDREGSRDEYSSCWIRVSQAHAGKGWGSFDLPRIGEEVIVSFLEGNPDRPVIKGRVYNAEAMPPFSLPAKMTRSGGKSDTHQGSGYNEVSADDTAGAEQLRTNAQYNMDAAVGNNQTLAVGVDKTEDIGNNDDLSVAVDSSTEVGNDAGITVGNNTTYEVANNIVIEAGTSITLACGASTIHMNQAGVITISGQFVTSAAKATNSIVAPLTTISGKQMLNQAGLLTLMLGGVAKTNGKGGTDFSGASVSIRGDEVVVKGGPIKLGEAGAPLVAIPDKIAGVPVTPNADGSISVGKGIKIAGDTKLQFSVLQDLEKIGKTASGQKLLASIEASGKTVTIHDLAGRSGPWAWTDPTPTGPTPWPGYAPPLGNSTAADAQVGVDPDFKGMDWHPNYQDADWAREENFPTDVVLFHELVHADDAVNGRLDAAPQPTGPHAGVTKFELAAAGLPPFHNAAYSENTYRAELGLPQRTYY
ncbi:MAG: type VI secretion system tip protein VgrG [Planctomycetaceae bacterium]|nr:type VI secretion system tip protein VgrG [Planctomycetaceae bacterium]MCB9926154.1 type VI secretion system tip protein VgrG [Planctomycetaceae bacterium]